MEKLARVSDQLLIKALHHISIICIQNFALRFIFKIILKRSKASQKHLWYVKVNVSEPQLMHLYTCGDKNRLSRQDCMPSCVSVWLEASETWVGKAQSGHA